MKTDAATGCVTLDLAEPAVDGAALSYVYNCSAVGTLRNAANYPDIFDDPTRSEI